MVINHAGTLRPEFFIAYMNLIMNAFECSVEQARNLTFERLFQSKEDDLGNESYKQFLKAYEAIKQ
ncbi:hypothetical protein [Metabacillus hrfriensis]|uniref:Uncharacterized protein n=1 Tax=Metabacillus hrfriensis TaxID=3048891 RepID=A0ACD4RDL2_9BACI|nr:hypothetical protein [Metabacillus sp. CT-WN-B3]WHZ58567.1 hypothetical protein QLQ22_04260 [Metabacillus sp. CT-WN-B3]